MTGAFVAFAGSTGAFVAFAGSTGAFVVGSFVADETPPLLTEWLGMRSQLVSVAAMHISSSENTKIVFIRRLLAPAC